MGNTFENLYLGIYNESASLLSKLDILYDNQFIRTTGSNPMDGIYIKSNSSLETKINGNLFNMNMGTGIYSKANNKLAIESNTIYNRSTNSEFKAVSLNQNFAKNSVIKLNDVFSLFPLSEGSNSGFDFASSSTLIVTDNRFYNSSSGSDQSNNISVEGTYNSIFRNNEFFNKQTAFNIQGVSLNNWFCCNTSTESGISFNVLDRSLGDYRNNTMHTLKLDVAGEIGSQPLPGNRWENNDGMNTGTLAQMEDGTEMKAVNNQIATDPNQGNYRPDNVDPVSIEADWFRDVSPETMSNCVTNPLCKDEGQFVNGGGNGGNGNEYNPWEPPTGDPPRGTLCDKVMENYFNYFAFANSGNDSFPNQTKWTMNDYLMIYINMYGQSFFDSCIQNNVIWILPDNEIWFDGEKTKDSIYIVDEPYKEISEELLIIADSLSNQIFHLTDTVFYENDTTILQVLYDELGDVTEEIRELSEDISEIQRLKALSFLQTIPSLPEPHGFLTARKKVWTAEVKCFLYGESAVTSQEWDEIRQVMLLCPIEAGKVVTEAKTLLLIQKEETHEYNYSACQGSNPRTKKEVLVSDDVFLYPNPGNNILQLNIPVGLSVKSLVLKNVHGVEVLNIRDGIFQNQTIDVSGMKSGLYFYEVQTYNHGGTYNGKLILIE